MSAHTPAETVKHSAAYSPEGRGRGTRNRYKFALFATAAVIGVVVLAGFLISGGMLPNANLPVVAAGNEPALIQGHVTGPTGFPAVGATVIASEQSSGYTINSLVSLDGQYSLGPLQPGNYIIMVAYPDGTNHVLRGVTVVRGSAQVLNFSY